MLVDMRVPGFDLAGAFRRHLEKRVRVVFDSSARDVHAVTITFSDVNGPRGGVDLQCAVEVAFSSGAHVRAEARDHDVVVALRRALTSANRALRSGKQKRARKQLRTAKDLQVGARRSGHAVTRRQPFLPARTGPSGR